MLLKDYRDLTRVMSRLKALYRGWAIPCAGQQVYAPHYRGEWLAKISEAGVLRSLNAPCLLKPAGSQSGDVAYSADLK